MMSPRVLSATANPQNPEEVEVARPSDALEAKEAADDAFTALFLGLGAVALLVGGVGIANVMVISVLERRSEIGLRRALGATKRHVAVQFLGEALLLSAVGGIGGVALGWAVTGIYANVKWLECSDPADRDCRRIGCRPDHRGDCRPLPGDPRSKDVPDRGPA